MENSFLGFISNIPQFRSLNRPPPNYTNVGFRLFAFPVNLETPGEELDNRSLEEILSSIPPPPPPAMASEAGAPRLMITHIVNQNFKSYAGEKILGPFHKVFALLKNL